MGLIVLTFVLTEICVRFSKHIVWFLPPTQCSPRFFLGYSLCGFLTATKLKQEKHMSSNDEKRNRKIELSKEAIALKNMREFRSMSVRNVGDLLNVSFTTVSHMENGRAKIHREYLENFLKALEFSKEDLKIFVSGKLKDESLKLKCLRIIEKMEPSKLEKVFAVLSVLSVAFHLMY